MTKCIDCAFCECKGIKTNGKTAHCQFTDKKIKIGRIRKCGSFMKYSEIVGPSEAHKREENKAEIRKRMAETLGVSQALPSQWTKTRTSFLNDICGLMKQAECASSGLTSKEQGLMAQGELVAYAKVISILYDNGLIEEKD